MSVSYGKPRSATGGEVPVCLCRQIMKHPATKPKLAGSEINKQLWMYCPCCGFKTHIGDHLNSVRAEWCGANKPGDEHIQQLWIKRYYEQQKEGVATRQMTVGTTVPV